MNIGLMIADILLALFMGFFAGRIYEMERGLYKKAYKDALEGWKQSNDILIEIGVSAGSIVKNDDGSIKKNEGPVRSPLQVKPLDW